MTTSSISRSDRELTEQWRRQEEVDTARIEQEARDRWVAEVEQAQRRQYLQDAEAAWESDIEPAQQQWFVDSALDAWTVGELDRCEAFCRNRRQRSAKVEGIRDWALGAYSKTAAE